MSGRGGMLCRMADRAVIFDVDGVLVDSYGAHFASWCALAESCGMEFPESLFAATFGRTSDDIIRRVWGADVPDTRVHELDDRKEALYRELIEDRFPEMPGAAALIRGLAADGWRIALGSSGPPENVELAVRKLGIGGRLGAIVTGRDVHKGKPDPEVFLIAAERLGAPPERCLVVEDAPAGVEAARRAGMLAIGFASRGRTAEELSAAGAARVIGSLAELDVGRIDAMWTSGGDKGRGGG